jgi:hypothetical protein
VTYEALLPEALAMIRKERHERIVKQAKPVDASQQSADVLVRVTDLGVVTNDPVAYGSAVLRNCGVRLAELLGVGEVLTEVIRFVRVEVMHPEE